MNKKLIIGYITQNDSDWLTMSLEAIEPIADKIIIIDGGSSPYHTKKLDNFIDGNKKYLIVHNEYPGSNGLQYETLLEECQKHKSSNEDSETWLLILDSDEIIGDNSHLIREYMNKEPNIYSIRMEHAISDLAHFDSTNGGTPKVNPKYEHYVLLRMFKLKDGIYFEGEEHSMVKGFTEAEHSKIKDVVIWHYGKAKSMYDLKCKFDMNMKRSNIHSKDFLVWWYTSHLFGNYPTKELLDYSVQPSVVRREFYLNKLVKKDEVVKK